MKQTKRPRQLHGNKPKKRSVWRKWMLRAALLVLALLLLPLPLLLPLRWFEPATTAFMLSHAIGDTTPIADRNWVVRNGMPDALPMSVIASEDQRFAQHDGVDFEAVNQAIAEYRKGQGLRGASTITQQLVKNLYLWQGQNFVRKGLEAYLALWADLLIPKHRVLEIYLNVVEFGDGVYGIEAAARIYFDKSVHELSEWECALLAAKLPAPKRYSVTPPSPYMQQRANWIMRQVEQLGTQLYLEQVRW